VLTDYVLFGFDVLFGLSQGHNGINSIKVVLARLKPYHYSKHKHPFSTISVSKNRRKYPKFNLNVVTKKQSLLSGCCEKVRGNIDVPKAWIDCSEAKTKLEASQHDSLQKSVQQSAMFHEM